MADGRIHAAVTTSVTIGMGIGSLMAYYLEPYQIGMVLLGCSMGILVTPDHDHDSGNISFYYVRKLSGKVGLWIWEVFWRPYMIAMRHRSYLTHGIGIGTFIRILYIILPVTIIAFAETKKIESLYSSLLSQAIVTPLYLVFPYIPLEALALLVMGVLISDIFHALWDM